MGQGLRSFVTAAAAAGLAALLAGDGSAQGAASGGMVAYNPENQHHYQVIRTRGAIPWVKAANDAAARSYLGVRGHLVTISSTSEQSFILANVNQHNAWLGAYRDQRDPAYRRAGGGWRWVTGEPWQFTAWNEKEPHNTMGEDAAVFWEGGRWMDIQAPPHQSASYVVEYPTTGPSAVKPVPEQLETLLTRIQARYKRMRSYSAEVSIGAKAHITELGGLNLNVILQPPGRFRIEGRGNNGSLLAVSDGRFFAMARTYPRERMHYVIKPARGAQSLQEALSLLIETPLPPSILAFILGGETPQLWTAAGKLGGIDETNADEEQIRSTLRMQYAGEEPTSAEAVLTVSPKQLQVSKSEISFRRMLYPFSAREEHTDIQIDAPIPAGAFTFQPTAGAIQVDDLGERPDEVRYRPGIR